MQTEVGPLQQQLQQVTAQRNQMATHAMQLQSAMHQLHNSPPLLNGAAAGGASGSPADSLHTYSGGASKPSKPPAGECAACRDGNQSGKQHALPSLQWAPELTASS